MRLGALLANIGTLSIPEAILHKTDSLSDEEIATIRHRCVLGAEMLAVVPQLRNVLPPGLHHREDFSGGDYPHKISGEEIPLGARIIRVVETYDALTSPRPYRPAFIPADALQLLANGSGREFDTRVGSAFTARRHRNLAIHDEILDRWHDMQRQALVWQMITQTKNS